MKNCLLIGNGLNRCCGGLSWDELLKKIANKYFIEKEDAVDATIAYEVMLNNAFMQKRNGEDFAYSIIEEVDKPTPQLLSRYMLLPIDTVLTTNYDYAIERTLEPDFEIEKYKKCSVGRNETVASNKRNTFLKEKHIYHIHGELFMPKSICLGTVHYANNLKKVMDNIVDGKGNQNDENRILSTVFDEEKINTWAEFFFNRNVYIVGLALYDCDIDLWWLISYRAYLKRQGDERINNNTLYITA